MLRAPTFLRMREIYMYGMAEWFDEHMEPPGSVEGLSFEDRLSLLSLKVDGVWVAPVFWWAAAVGAMGGAVTVFGQPAR